MTTKPVQEAKPERQGWRERFDEKFKNHFCCNGDYCYGPCSEVVEDDVKAFIESELRSALEGLEPENIAGTTDRIDLLTGGFPCQPFSQAGKRKGTDDERHLWPEMLGVIRLTKPTWVIAENVRGLLTLQGGVVFEQVCLDLEASGYEVQPVIIPACAVNAPHRRDRVWFIGHATDNGQHGSKDTKGDSQRGNHYTKRAQEVRQPKRADSLRNTITDTKRKGYKGEKHQTRQDARRDSRVQHWREDWLEAATRLCIMDDGLPNGLARPKGWRNAAIKATGNAIVPQIAIEIMRSIKACNL